MFLNQQLKLIYHLVDADWDKETFQWLADASSTGQQEPTMTFYFGELDGVADGRELVVPLANLSDNVAFVNNIYTFDVEANDIENYVNAQGISFNKVTICNI